MFNSYSQLPRSVFLLCFGAFVNRAGTFLLPFLTNYLQGKLELGVRFATWAFGVYGAGSLAGMLAGGHFADRWGRRGVMLCSMFGAAIVLALFGFLTSRPAILVAVFALALIAEMYRPAVSAMIADVTPPERRAEAFGLMYVAVNLGFAVSAAIGGLIAQHSFQVLFWLDAATAAAFGVLILFSTDETLPTRKKLVLITLPSSQGRDSIPGDPPARADRGDVSLVESLLQMAKDHIFVGVWLGSFGIAVTYMQAMSTFPLYLNQLGMETAVYGTVMAVNGAMIVVLQLPTTSVVTRFNRGTMISLAALITAVGFGMKSMVTSAFGFGLAVAVWTIGEMVQSPLMPAIVSDLAPVNQRARYQGVFSMCYSLAMMIGAPLGGLCMSRWGGRSVWVGCVVMGLFASAMFTLVGKSIRKGGVAKIDLERNS